MKNLRIKAILCLLVMVVLLIPISVINEVTSLDEEKNVVLVTHVLNGGWLEEQNGVKILHLNGSYYDMGYQHGYLLKDEIQENMRAQLVYFEDHGYSYEDILEVWNIMDDYLPNEYKEEMQGMADGAGVSFEDMAVLNTMPALFNHLFACCEISLWGNATADGKLYHIRSLDWSLELRDPETETLLLENIVLFVRNPENGYASMYPEFAGDITCWSGVNEKGIAVGEDTCLTNDTTFHGICPAFRMRMTLDCADTAEDAIAILISNRTCGTNFVVSDANVPIGYAIDQTANISYVGTWDDPSEGIDPFWQIEDVVRRTPMFVSPECAAVEIDRIRYDPSGLKSLLYALTGDSYMFIGWTHYRALSDQIEEYYGTLDLNSSMAMLRAEYVGETDFILNILMFFDIYQCLAQWVACPESGDMTVSFASPGTRACYNTVHYFKFYELLEAEPP